MVVAAAQGALAAITQAVSSVPRTPHSKSTASAASGITSRRRPAAR